MIVPLSSPPKTTLDPFLMGVTLESSVGSPVMCFEQPLSNIHLFFEELEFAMLLFNDTSLGTYMLNNIDLWYPSKLGPKGLALWKPSPSGLRLPYIVITIYYIPKV